MEGEPYDTPFASSEYFSEQRKRGLLRLGIRAMFEAQMRLADDGEVTREQAIARIRKLGANILAAQAATD